MEHHGFKFINSESTTRELATLLYTTPSLLLQHPTASVATVPCPGLPGPAPSQAPQSTHREDGGEERGHADRDERPDEEKGSAGVGDPAAVHHIYAARTRNGFTPKLRAELLKKVKPLEAAECPFANLPEQHAGRWGAGLPNPNGVHLARYLVTGKENEVAELWQLRRFAAEDIVDAFRRVHVIAAATKCRNLFFHVSLRCRQGERLDRSHWPEAV